MKEDFEHEDMPTSLTEMPDALIDWFTSVEGFCRVNQSNDDLREGFINLSKSLESYMDVERLGRHYLELGRHLNDAQFNRLMFALFNAQNMDFKIYRKQQNELSKLFEGITLASRKLTSKLKLLQEYHWTEGFNQTEKLNNKSIGEVIYALEALQNETESAVPVHPYAEQIAISGKKSKSNGDLTILIRHVLAAVADGSEIRFTLAVREALAELLSVAMSEKYGTLEKTGTVKEISVSQRKVYDQVVALYPERLDIE